MTNSLAIHQILSPIESFTENLLSQLEQVKNEAVHKNPVKQKYQNALKEARIELKNKYYHLCNGWGDISGSLYKIQNNSIGDIVDYIRKTKREYTDCLGYFTYKPRSDDYLFIVCCELVRQYYGQTKLERILLGYSCLEDVNLQAAYR